MRWKNGRRGLDFKNPASLGFCAFAWRACPLWYFKLYTDISCYSCFCGSPPNADTAAPETKVFVIKQTNAVILNFLRRAAATSDGCRMLTSGASGFIAPLKRRRAAKGARASFVDCQKLNPALRYIVWSCAPPSKSWITPTQQRRLQRNNSPPAGSLLAIPVRSFPASREHFYDESAPRPI